jgi:glycerol-3-phosphate dehydrogenase
MQLYDALSLDKSLPRRKWLDRDEALAAEPSLDPEGLWGAWRFYDAQVPLVERLVIENVVDAAEHGALVLNHARALGYLRDGTRVTGARVRDEIGGTELELRARFTVNATGPWLDRTIAPVRRDPKPLLRLTKGTHIVTPRATEKAHVLFAKSDGRLFFVLPWLDGTIVGTTDTDYTGDPADAAATEEDVRYLQTEARRAFPEAPFDQIHYTYAGVRALVREEGVSEGEVSRKHALFDHERRDGIAGLLSVVGGKITAYRDIAEQATDAVLRKLGKNTGATTADTPLPGARSDAHFAGPLLGVDKETARHIERIYGTRARDLLSLASAHPELRGPLCSHHRGIAAEVVYVVLREWANTLGDVLLRRTALGLMACQGLDCIEAVADHVGMVFGWDNDRREREIAAYRAEIAPMRRFSVA